MTQILGVLYNKSTMKKKKHLIKSNSVFLFCSLNEWIYTTSAQMNINEVEIKMSSKIIQAYLLCWYSLYCDLKMVKLEIDGKFMENANI